MTLGDADALPFKDVFKSIKIYLYKKIHLIKYKMNKYENHLNERLNVMRDIHMWYDCSSLYLYAYINKLI